MVYRGVAKWSRPAAHNGFIGGSNPSTPTKRFNIMRFLMLILAMNWMAIAVISSLVIYVNFFVD